MKKRLRTFFIGKPLKDSELKQQKLGVLWGMSTFSSDTISTVSYAGEEILLVLIPVLGTAAYWHFIPIVAGITVLLALLIIGYREMIDLYPRGGGAYTVAMDNLGEAPGLIAGSSLVIEYIMSVAVSASAAAAAIVSAFPAAEPYRAWIATLLIALLAWGHLRGTRESSVLFGIPTYLFIFIMLTLVAVGSIRRFEGGFAELPVPPEEAAGMTETVWAALRAFATGCTAIAGVESVSNGVTAFKAPSQATAKKVLLAMFGVVSVIFLGTTVLISYYHIVPNSYETAISQLARAVFGIGSPMYYIAQTMTVLILILAANTAFADLPHLMAIMAHDDYLPRRFISRGSRLNYTNGILFMSVAAALTVAAFKADQHKLMPLFAALIFISFFLHQLGMLRYWTRRREGAWRAKAAMNCLTLTVIAVTLTVLIISSFLGGAWFTLLCIAVLMTAMMIIHRHYEHVKGSLRLRSEAEVRSMLSSTRSAKAIIPIRTLNRAFLKAYNCARDLGFKEIELYHVDNSEEQARELREKLRRCGVEGSFVCEITEYRDAEDVLIRHVEREEKKLRRHEHLTVMIPNLVTLNPLKQYLHNEVSRELLHRMARYRYVYIFQVPYLFG